MCGVGGVGGVAHTKGEETATEEEDDDASFSPPLPFLCTQLVQLYFGEKGRRWGGSDGNSLTRVCVCVLYMPIKGGGGEEEEERWEGELVCRKKEGGNWEG